MPAYKVVKKIKAKGWPTSSSHYPYAHRQADLAEKKKYGKSYQRMKKIDAKLKKGELAGKNTKSGKIEVSATVPKKYRKEVALHETREYRILKRLRKK